MVELREHHRAKEGTSNGRSIKQGDIVTVMEEGKSNRGTWKLGRVQEVHPGNDGFARGATLEVISNKRKRICIKSRSCIPLKLPQKRLLMQVHQHTNVQNKDPEGRQQLLVK